MIRRHDLIVIALGLAVAGLTVPSTALAQASESSPTTPATEPGHDKPKKPRKAKKQAKAEPQAPLPDAAPEQVAAAHRVFTGSSQCEFGQTVTIEANPKHVGYLDVKHGKKSWIMRPVLSSTGAMRLEDVRAQTLLIQIGTKSMLLDQKSGRRIVDECRTPQQMAQSPTTTTPGLAAPSTSPAAPAPASANH